jgi:signal recognition particle subunit SEC65
MMNAIMNPETVRLAQALPELGLYAGQIGVVLSSWLYPNQAYEVEFDVQAETRRERFRLLLLQDQVAFE